MQNDFFAFCTSLPVTELRAIGALSSVKHYGEHDLVYSPGDESSDLFIMNRGLVEITPGPDQPGGSIVLCRGDVFGETGAFTRAERDHTARACSIVSVQCFASKNFAELVLRVPSFVLFLCENIARRLTQARTIEAGCELSGSLVNFDLITIYQTIVRSMRTGTLFINDERGEIVSEFHFESGRPCWGRFRHLLGEEAFWQLFIQPRKSWTFTFSRELPAHVDFKEHKTITRDAEEMLIQAIQMRDEFDSVQKELPDDTALLKRQQLNFAWSNSDLEELRPIGEEIWQVAYSQPISLADLCAHCTVCALRIYLVVAEMLRSGLFAWVAATPTETRETNPPGAKITALQKPAPSPDTDLPDEIDLSCSA
ncbi:MAG TPA: cyclic nucleotide-binding domain-containing protein [Chthoniobacterales bacterium]|nr:cyclic nucleotide-binding domain-containing protein [Chthoniobacterales bacterium]